MTHPNIENSRTPSVKWRTPAEVREESNPHQPIHGGRWGAGESDQGHPAVARNQPVASQPRPDLARRQGHLARWDDEGGATERSR